MKTVGIYYIANVDKLIIITKYEYYEDLYNEPFTIVTWEDENGVYPKTLIKQDKLCNFQKIGNI